MKLKKIPLLLLFAIISSAAQQNPCIGGMAGPYACNGYDLQSHISLATMNTTGANDSWGWTDPLDNKEYALMGLEDGTAFIDISNPQSPIYLGKLPTHTNPSDWRDVKTYNNYAFIVSEAGGHGMQVFDLTRLRNVSNPPVSFTDDAHYDGFGAAHNLVINEATGYAYAVGTGSYNGGSHFVNIQDPLNPIAAGGYGSDGYTHDAQVVIYSGPDTNYTGREILVSSSGSMGYISIVDVTDKANPQGIAVMSYSNVGYTHQGWFTEDQRYFLVGDEFDESAVGFNTRTVVFDMLDLDNPQIHHEYFGPTPAIDHNGYVNGDTYYLANYAAGFREIDISDIANSNMTEVGFFDTYPSNNNANYNGVWNVYPYFGSGNIMISDRSGGFFLVKSSVPDTEDPVAVCQNVTVSLDENGTYILNASLVDGGSSDNSGFYSLSLSPNTFDCNDLGNVTATLTVTDPSGNTDTCTATITVLDDSAPDLSCPANTTVPFDAGEEFYTVVDFVGNGTVTAIDNCTAGLAISQDPAPGMELTEGTYTIAFESQDASGNTGTCSFELTVVDVLSVSENELADGLAIFPNPASETITIHSANISVEAIVITDMLGKTVFTEKYLNTMEMNVDLSAFAKGIYFLTINDMLTKKIIKK